MCPSAKKEAKLRRFSVPPFFSSFLLSFPIPPSVFFSVPVFYGFSYKFSFAYSSRCVKPVIFKILSAQENKRRRSRAFSIRRIAAPKLKIRLFLFLLHYN